MAMNDEETVALIAGGHTFGKTHGANPEQPYIGREPEGAGLEEQGFGWKNSFGSGKGVDTYTSGLEGAWTADPISWDNGFFDNLYNYEWELTESPAGAKQWTPVDASAKDTVPDAHDPSKRHAPIMLTTDLALRMDPVYGPISKRFHENPDQFAEAFAKAWFKLTHRDMGPVSRYLGALVPSEPQLFQDPIPSVDHELIGPADIAALKAKVLASGLTISELASTAWASAASFRGTDKRGGANGARIRLAPQNSWEVNHPTELAAILATLEGIQQEFNGSQAGGKRVSLADLIVLAGCAAVEQAARNGGHDVTVPFHPGRTDALQELTDVESFAVLEPIADGFRNYVRAGEVSPPEHLLVERANLLTLTVPEMTVLVGGMRALGTNFGHSKHGIFSDRSDALTNDFFVNLLDMSTEWTPSASEKDVYEGHDRISGAAKWTGTAVDLVFGSNSQLRAVAEVYACDDSEEKFVLDFVAAWAKVMDLDRYDLA
jgi:catalase-peroxidase